MFPKCKRRWLGFSLKALLLALTLFGIWLGMQVNRAQKQRAAVAWVEEHGGRAQLSHQPRGPNRLQELIGDEYFRSVVSVSFRFDDSIGTKTELDVTPLAVFSHLRYLHLSNRPVADLSPLTSLNKLESLSLGDKTQIADLSPLKELKSLKKLDLRDTQIMDLSILTPLTNLQVLLVDGEISDLSPLQELRSLLELYLPASASDAQVGELQKKLPECKITQEQSRP